MSDFKRQHPVSAVAGVIDLVRENLVTIIVILVFGAGSGGPSFIWMFTSLFVLLLLYGIAGWWRFQYRIEDGELQIRRGVRSEERRVGKECRLRGSEEGRRRT